MFLRYTEYNKQNHMQFHTLSHYVLSFSLETPPQNKTYYFSTTSLVHACANLLHDAHLSAFNRQNSVDWSTGIVTPVEGSGRGKERGLLQFPWRNQHRRRHVILCARQRGINFARQKQRTLPCMVAARNRYTAYKKPSFRAWAVLKFEFLPREKIKYDFRNIYSIYVYSLNATLHTSLA
jgi:hypothetical protein